MAKRPKRRMRDIDPGLLELMKESADLGPLLDADGRDAPWYTALAKLDKTGDKTLLIDLLKSGQELTPTIRRHIAHLLNRYALKRKPGKQATPSYVLSEAMNRLFWLVFTMDQEDMSIDEAADEYATDEFSADTLLDAYHGKHGGFARAMRAMKGAKK